MAVKRVVVEIDDSPDAEQSTSLPAGLGAEAGPASAELHATDLPERQPDYDGALEGRAPGRPTTSETVGRTLADLVHAFICRPQFPAIALFIVAVIIFSPQTHKLNDLLLPAVVGFAFNVLWFGIAGCARLRRRLHQNHPPR
jgi:hypothetical protein